MEGSQIDKLVEERAGQLVAGKLAELDELLEKMRRSTNIMNVPDMKCLAYIGERNGSRGAEGTSEPIWLFQTKCEWFADTAVENIVSKEEKYGYILTEDDLDLIREAGDAHEYWETKSVFLSREEAERYGESRDYEWGKDGWRVYCISLWRTEETRHILSAIDVGNLESRRKNEL